MTNRTKNYIESHPEHAEVITGFQNLIDEINTSCNVKLTVTEQEVDGTTTVISPTLNPKVSFNFVNCNGSDNLSILIIGKRTYSFEPSAVTTIKSSEAMYSIKLTQFGNEYFMRFSLSR